MLVFWALFAIASSTLFLFLGTYTTRSKRSIDKYAMIDVAEAEKKLVEELGEKVCIYTKVCLHHAHKAMRNGSKHKIDVDWNEVFR